MKLFLSSWIDSKSAASVQSGGLCWDQRLIILTLFYFFLSYPFAIRNLMGVVYSVLLNGLLIATFFICSMRRTPILTLRLYRDEKILAISILLYGLYFSVLMMSSFFNSIDSIVLMSTIYKIRELLFALVILYLLNDKGILLSLKLYVKILTWCSVLGLLLVVLNFMGIIYPIAEVNLDNFPGGGANNRLFFGIGFIWPNTWLGSPVGFERLQSFTDEAGTFAFAVLPAILLATHWRMKLSACIMIVALIFTFSVGAISFWLVIFLFGFLASIIQEGIKLKSLLVFLFFIVVFFLVISYFPFDLVEQADRYFSAKYTIGGGSETSIGQRLAGLEIVLNSIREHPLGFGANSSGISLDLGEASLAVGWFIPLIEAGVIGWLIYLLTFGLVLVHALLNAIGSVGLKRVCAIVILLNGYAAFQRAGIDANPWQLFWLISYIRIIGMDEKNLDCKYLENKRQSSVDFRSDKIVAQGYAL